MTNTTYTYRTVWSEEDQEYAGLCDKFPSLSWLCGSSFNIRLPQHYAESLVELSESEGRSQHNLLLRMVCAAIDEAIKEA